MRGSGILLWMWAMAARSVARRLASSYAPLAMGSSTTEARQRLKAVAVQISGVAVLLATHVPLPSFSHSSSYRTAMMITNGFI